MTAHAETPPPVTEWGWGYLWSDSVPYSCLAVITGGSTQGSIEYTAVSQVQEEAHEETLSSTAVSQVCFSQIKSLAGRWPHEQCHQACSPQPFICEPRDIMRNFTCAAAMVTEDGGNSTHYFSLKRTMGSTYSNLNLTNIWRQSHKAFLQWC